MSARVAAEGHGPTCFPLARKIPAVTAQFPSKTWNSATSGSIEATSDTTSFSIASTLPRQLRNRAGKVVITDLDHH